MAHKVYHHLAAMRRQQITGIYEYRNTNGERFYTVPEKAKNSEKRAPQGMVYLWPKSTFYVKLVNDKGALFYQVPASFRKERITKKSELIEVLKGKTAHPFIVGNMQLVATFSEQEAKELRNE